MSVTAEGVNDLVDLINELCGIYLDDSKLYLIDSRFGSMVKKHNCESYNALARLARRASHSDLQEEIVDAITTNETLFFRDNSPFEAMRHKILPDLIDKAESGLRPKRLNIWSAASSTGQEPYSVAMTLQEVIPDIHTWNISIFGTDVSADALDKARKGVYTELEIGRGLDDSKRANFFVSEKGQWKVSKQIREMVHFERRNLLESFPEHDSFDLVLCRNVAIYFQKDQRDMLFKRIVETMVPGGYLIVGAAESLGDLGPEFAPQTHCNCSVYRPKPEMNGVLVS